MLYSRGKIYLHFVILCLLIIVIPDIIFGLQDVSIVIPAAVRRGENAIFICNYDLENDTLYTVKWYKGRREFYRYTPKEKPSVQIFALSGINVERTISNQSHIVLPSVQFNASGKYRCEVSADAPSFHTEVVHGEMEVVEIPTEYPIITGIHTKYRLGDIINGNCSSDFSKPAANLTWTINEIPVNSSYIKTFKGLKNPLNEFLEAAILEINFIINQRHYIRGKLILKCTASIYDIYEGTIERLIEEDRPMILASGRQPDINLYTFNNDGEMEDSSELLLKNGNLKSFATSLSSKSSILKIINKLYQFILNKDQKTSTQRTTKLKEFRKFDVLFNIVAVIIFLLILLLTNNTSNIYFSNINFISKFRVYKRKSNKKKDNCCWCCWCYWYCWFSITFSNKPSCKQTVNDNNKKKCINKNNFCLDLEQYYNNKKVEMINNNNNSYNHNCIYSSKKWLNILFSIIKNYIYNGFSCATTNNNSIGIGKSNKLNFMAS